MHQRRTKFLELINSFNIQLFIRQWVSPNSYNPKLKRKKKKKKETIKIAEI